MKTTPLTDEDLVAYLDGALEESHQRVVQEALARDEDGVRRRLEALTVDTDAIRSAFDDLSRMAPPAPSFGPAARPAPAPAPRRFSPVLAGVIGAAMAASVTMVVWPEKREGWHDYVASYQALYVDATLSHLDPAPADQRAELDRVAEAIGRDLSLETLTGEAQLDYKRAQVLGFETQPLVQLAFQSKDGAPYALCIIRREEAGDDEALALTRMEGLSTATWSSGAYAYMLIGGTDDALVGNAARRFAMVL